MSEDVLIRALPRHISNHWGVIGRGIKETAPDYFTDDKDSMNNILQSLLTGKMQCWVAMSMNGSKEQIPYGFIITHTTVDVMSGVKNLLVLCMYSFRTHTPDPRIYVRGLSVLKKYAKEQGCKNIIAYTKIKELVNFVEQILKGDVSQRLITIPLED